MSVLMLIHIMSLKQYSQRHMPRVKTLESHAWDKVISGVCDLVCVSVCPHSKMKLAWAINTKLGAHILYGSRHALTWGSKG